MSLQKIFRQDYRQTKLLVRAASAGGDNAVRRSKALGLTTTYIEDGLYMRSSPMEPKKKLVLWKEKNLLLF